MEVKNGLEILKQLTVDLTSVKTLFQAFDQIDRLMAENGDSFKEIQDFSIQREFTNELKENFNDLWVGFTSKLECRHSRVGARWTYSNGARRLSAVFSRYLKESKKSHSSKI